MGITKTMDEDIYQKHVAMSIFYCGNFIQTLGTTERVHNLEKSRSICLLLFCIMFLRLVFILCRFPALPLYSNVEMIHGCLYISTVSDILHWYCLFLHIPLFRMVSHIFRALH